MNCSSNNAPAFREAASRRLIAAIAAAIGLLALFAAWPASRYYSTRDLDVVPGIMTRVEPQYPESAARRFLSGKVVVRLFIDESGKVERVLTLRAVPPGYFEQNAEHAFRAARFSPGMKDGRAVKVQMTLEVSFEHPAPPHR